MREKTYYPELSLIQIATEADAWCIDPLAITDLSPLGSIFLNRDILKVFHAASQDVEILYYQFGEMPGPVFDTQIAASMLGQGEQVGYGNLVKATLNIELEKTQSRTDWSRRPLSAAQLSYAADDVIYLCKVYTKLSQTLSDKGRMQWLDADFAKLESTSNFDFDANALLKRVKGHQRLRPRQLAIVREIAGWREIRAKQINKPRRWVLGDEIVLDIAKQQPSNIEELSQIRGLHANIAKHHGEKLLHCIAEGQAAEEEDLPRPPKKKKLKAEQSVLVDMLMGIISYAAFKADISPSLLATRKELEKVVLGEDSALMSGWRNELAGKSIDTFLKGESSLSVENGELMIR